MKPVYTIHAGEYFVGSHIEKIRSKWHVWFPSKDTGIDLLISNANNSKTVSIQVKSSKDYSRHYNNPDHRNNLIGRKVPGHPPSWNGCCFGLHSSARLANIPFFPVVRSIPEMSTHRIRISSANRKPYFVL